jgi:hypothetical protein
MGADCARHAPRDQPGRGVRANTRFSTLAAPAPSGCGPARPSVAPVVITSSTTTTRSPSTRAVTRKAPRTLAARAFQGSPACGAVSTSRTNRRQGHRQPPAPCQWTRQLRRLVETPATQPRNMQRHRNDQIRLGRRLRCQQLHEQPAHRQAMPVLQSLHKAVQRKAVIQHRQGPVEGRGMTKAGTTYAAGGMGNAANRTARLLTSRQSQQTVRTQHALPLGHHRRSTAGEREPAPPPIQGRHPSA